MDPVTYATATGTRAEHDGGRERACDVGAPGQRLVARAVRREVLPNHTERDGLPMPLRADAPHQAVDELVRDDEREEGDENEQHPEEIERAAAFGVQQEEPDTAGSSGSAPPLVGMQRRPPVGDGVHVPLSRPQAQGSPSALPKHRHLRCLPHQGVLYSLKTWTIIENRSMMGSQRKALMDIDRLLLNPARLRIMQYLRLRGRVRTSDIVEHLDDVPCATVVPPREAARGARHDRGGGRTSRARGR